MRSAFAFLTAVGRSVRPTRGALGWFPVVGLAVGFVVGTLWWGAAQVWPPLVAAVLVVSADLVVTGFLHVDGLADSADGLIAPMPRERRLEVMALPDTGAFGVAAVVSILVLRAASVTALPADPEVIVAFGGIWCASRALMAVTLCSAPYARPGGLAEAFRGGHPSLPSLVGAVLASPLLWLSAGTTGIVALAGVGIGFGSVLALALRRIGGFTGDVLGASGMVAETCGLLVLVGRWP